MSSSNIIFVTDNLNPTIFLVFLQMDIEEVIKQCLEDFQNEGLSLKKSKELLRTLMDKQCK